MRGATAGTTACSSSASFDAAAATAVAAACFSSASVAAAAAVAAACSSSSECSLQHAECDSHNGIWHVDTNQVGLGILAQVGSTGAGPPGAAAADLPFAAAAASPLDGGHLAGGARALPAWQERRRPGACWPFGRSFATFRAKTVWVMPLVGAAGPQFQHFEIVQRNTVNNF